ncbi:MAG: hypothetical protein CFH22_01308 [Alphaproteobacteria bacterium MarineAlpha5_Bin12]|nr:hypothetical protein [Pelagibacteraceae bacterium]PPR40811.1 MAG: hypothetical protein CFH22_01308 [Alphaproteobacteria bacterium MarineAlpha5_Bin12]|tara:strand:+ start:32496 stop:33341 length:846 start_codon:yes stop_codon:yes gene_type:complete
MDSKKFIWLSSYPKSGNTMIRLFLSAYFFSKEGKINSLKEIKHISNFQNLLLTLPNIPSYEDFKKDLSKVCPLWLNAQETNAPLIKKSLILKTHSFMGKINNYPLTSSKYTKGFIYIVRDPRSVCISNMHHYNFSINESVKSIFDDKRFSLGLGAPVPEIISSWKNHYLSWKKFSSEVPNIIVKYEDLIDNKEKELEKILKFLSLINKFELNLEKLKNSINSIDFKKVKKMEEDKGFDEKLHGNSFFRKGLKDEWKNELSKKLQFEIEKKFENEMKELGYI